MLKRRILKAGVAMITVSGLLGGLSTLATGTSLAATKEHARPVAMMVTVSPDYTCYFPITGFYCYAQTEHGNAPLFRSSGALYTKLPLNDKVKVTCFYYGNPPAPWKGDGYQDHVTWENIANPITGHIPDYYVNLGNQTPIQAGIPQC
jgi:hypothetical protein